MFFGFSCSFSLLARQQTEPKERALFPEAFFAKAKTRDAFLKLLQDFAISLRKAPPMLRKKIQKTSFGTSSHKLGKILPKFSEGQADSYNPLKKRLPKSKIQRFLFNKITNMELKPAPKVCFTLL